MSNELPDLDEDVSFVVDQGAPVGPMPLRSIIDSIRSGERAPDVLVWWAGASDWVPFAGEAELFALLQELPATNQPPPPPPAELLSSEPEKPSFAEPEITTFDVSSTESDRDDTPSDDPVSVTLEEEIVEDDDLDEVGDLDLLDPVDPLDEADDHQDSDDLELPQFDPVAEAEADALLARDSRAMHPSTGWGLATDEEDEDQGDTELYEADAIDEGDHTTTTTLEVVDEGDSVDEGDVVDEETDVLAGSDRATDFEDLAAMAPDGDDSPVRPRGLSGLFGEPARTDAGLTGADLPRVDFEIDETVRSSLETVGARIDALTSATRRAQQQLGLRRDVWASDPPGGPPTQDIKPEPEPEPNAESGSWQAVDVPDLDQRFAEMVQASVERQRRLDWALRVDELLLSACITAVVDSGFVLLDLATKDSDHRALFDHNDDSRHVRLEISPLSALNAAGDPIGRHVQVSMAWGREVADADEASRVVRSEASDDEAAPGTFTCEMNMVSSSASTCVDLIWTADEFVRDDHNVDRASLDASIAAILHALEQRWHELFVAAY